MGTYTVRAIPWGRGWELHVKGVGVTQVRVLEKAEQQVRDLIATVNDVDKVADEIVITPDIGDDLDREIEDVRRMHERVQSEQRDVAARSRALVRRLRDRGLSVSDTGTLLHVSRGRISQLAK
ncbi:MAG: antitoxin HicB [Mycobacteriales bacterium]